MLRALRLPLVGIIVIVSVILPWQNCSAQYYGKQGQNYKFHYHYNGNYGGRQVQVLQTPPPAFPQTSISVQAQAPTDWNSQLQRPVEAGGDCESVKYFQPGSSCPSSTVRYPVQGSCTKYIGCYRKNGALNLNSYELNCEKGQVFSLRNSQCEPADVLGLGLDNCPQIDCHRGTAIVIPTQSRSPSDPINYAVPILPTKQKYSPIVPKLSTRKLSSPRFGPRPIPYCPTSEEEQLEFGPVERCIPRIERVEPDSGKQQERFPTRPPSPTYEVQTEKYYPGHGQGAHEQSTHSSLPNFQDNKNAHESVQSSHLVPPNQNQSPTGSQNGLVPFEEFAKEPRLEQDPAVINSGSTLRLYWIPFYLAISIYLIVI